MKFTDKELGALVSIINASSFQGTDLELVFNLKKKIKDGITKTGSKTIVKPKK